MTVAVVNYVRFKSFGGQYQSGFSFQNFYINQTKTKDGVDYMFAPLGVTPGAGTKGGDRSDSALVAPAYPLTVNLFVDACKQKWLVEITMVLLDPLTFEEVQLITTEQWLSSKVEVTTERAVLRLSSPLDAVDSQVPKRMLSSVLVGSLPSTGNLSVS